MSKQAIVFDNGQQAIITTDLTKIFIGRNRHISGSLNYTNSTYDDLVIVAGTVMGRKTSDNSVYPFASDASDGTQYVLGILREDVTVLAGTSLTDHEVDICVEGNVAQEQIALAKAGDTLTTVVNGRTIADKIAAETVGVLLVTSTQVTKEDNE